MQDINSFFPLWGVWELDGLLGEGSFAKVYKIKRTELGKTYYAAVKHISIPDDKQKPDSLINEGVASTQEDLTNYYKSMLQSITNEINTCYTLKSNTNIVGYEDHTIVPKPTGVGYDIFIRMELLSSLSETSATAAPSEKEVIKLGADICKALELLERMKLIHRDIKPANIFISANGDYKLGDFGVARTLENTVSGVTLKGTYNYMAPEVLKGHAVNCTADIYSLGIVLYRYLNGNRLPFLPPSGQITYEESQRALDRRMSGETVGAPAYISLPGLRETILRACEFDPKLRFQHAGDMRKALESVLAGNPDWNLIRGAENTGTGDGNAVVELRGEKKKQNLPLIIGICAGAAVALALAVAIGVSLSSKPEEEVLAPEAEVSAQLQTTPSAMPLPTELPSPGGYTPEEINARLAYVQSDWWNGSFDNAVVGDGIEVQYDSDGSKRMVYVTSQNPGYAIAYYYDTLYFVYILRDNLISDELYYADDGVTLMRWIDEYGTAHDFETDNPEWAGMEAAGISAARQYNYRANDIQPSPMYFIRDRWSNNHGQLAAYSSSRWDMAVRLCDQNPGFNIFSSTGEMLYSSGQSVPVATTEIPDTRVVSEQKPQFKAVKIDGITWHEATEAAFMAGGYLAVPNSSSEWTAIINACKQAGIARAWLGGWNTIDIDSMTYEYTNWVDGTFQSDVPWWHEGEPSCYDPGTGMYEEYVLLWDLYKDGTWTLNDAPSDAPLLNPKGFNGSFGYVIEYDW